MSVLDRDALEQSPLADLHAIASELSIDGYRRLRRAALIDAILERQSGDAPAPVSTADDDAEEEDGEVAVEVEVEVEGEPADEAREDEEEDDEQRAPRRRRGRRGGRGRGAAREQEDELAAEDSPREEEETEEEPASEDTAVEGVVELLPNGSGFVRVDPPDPSDNDVYISAAQVRRCELVSGDRISGPRRAPRRSERFASLVRIDTINGQPADQAGDGGRYDDLPAAFPSERFRLGSEDPTVKAIEWLTPIGRGSRVTIVGAARAGKTETLRRLAEAFAQQEDLQRFVVLAGVRPEEIPEWNTGAIPPAAAVSFAASPDAQGQTVERIVEQARRFAARGAHVVVLIDTLEGIPPAVARKLLAAARNIVDGGSLTIDRHGERRAGRRDDGHRARRDDGRLRPLSGAGPARQRHDQAGAARRGRRRGGDRAHAGRGPRVRVIPRGHVAQYAVHRARCRGEAL